MPGRLGPQSRHLLQALRRRRTLLVATFLVVSSLTAHVTLTAPRVYEAEARIVVGVSRETVGLDPTLTGPPKLPVFQSREYQINQEIAELESRAHMGKVVDLLGPQFILGQTGELPAASEGAPAAAPGKRLRQRLERLNLVDRVSQREQAILRFGQRFSVRSEYNSNVLYLAYRDHTPRRAQTILDAAIRIHLISRTSDKTDKTSYDFFLGEIVKLEAGLKSTDQRIQELRQQYGIASLEMQKNLLTQRMGGLADALNAVEADLAASRAALKTMRESLDPGLQAEQVRVETLRARRQALREQMDGLRRELAVVNRVEVEIKRLEREASTQERNLAKYTENLELARINQALDREQITNLTVLQDREPPGKKVSPRTTQNLLLGMILGLLAGTGVALLREQLDSTIKTEEEASQALSVPAVFTVPLVNIRKQAARSGHQQGISAWEFLVRLRGELAPKMNGSAFVMAVTSCGRGEGVSTVSSGLAYGIAGVEGYRVLLVDANLHHEAREQGADATQSLVETVSLRSLTNGHGYGLQAPLWLEAIEAKERYRFIVLDLPAVEEGPAALWAASRADATLLVVQSQKVPRERALFVKERIARMGGRLLAAVLNKQQVKGRANG